MLCIWRLIHRLFPIIHNKNVYRRVDNNCGDGSCNVLPYYGHLYFNVFPENTFSRSNKNPTSTDLFIPYLHSGGKNIGSNQSKQILPTVFTNITIDKMD